MLFNSLEGNRKNDLVSLTLGQHYLSSILKHLIFSVTVSDLFKGLTSGCFLVNSGKRGIIFRHSLHETCLGFHQNLQLSFFIFNDERMKNFESRHGDSKRNHDHDEGSAKLYLLLTDYFWHRLVINNGSMTTRRTE